MNAASTTVAVGPIYQFVEPYLLALFNFIVIPILLGWIGYIMNRYTGIKISDSANARLQGAAQNAAGRIFAGMEPAAANMRVDVHSQVIANEVPKVQAKVADAITALGITPAVVDQHVADLITGKLGILQASQSAPSTPTQ